MENGGVLERGTRDRTDTGRSQKLVVSIVSLNTLKDFYIPLQV